MVHRNLKFLLILCGVKKIPAKVTTQLEAGLMHLMIQFSTEQEVLHFQNSSEVKHQNSSRK